MKQDSAEIREIRKCPLCGRAYAEHPALSRTDNKTPICPDCGIRQALSSIGIARDEQETILEIIHHDEQRIRRGSE